jgi:hypothetical protein
MRLRKVVFALGMAGLLAVGSSGPVSGATPPPKLVGLDVAKENISKSLRKTTRPEYLTDVSLYSLRQSGKELQATIQIGQFRKGAPTSDHGFQREIAAKVGTLVPREQRVGDVTVYVTKVKKLDIALWFRGGHLFILSIKEGFQQPKSLIRQAVGIPG